MLKNPRRMKLSTAILKGCKGTKKTYWYYIDDSRCKVCSQGAAYLALGGGGDNYRVKDELERVFPELGQRPPLKLPQMWTLRLTLASWIDSATTEHSREWVAKQLKKVGL